MKKILKAFSILAVFLSIILVFLVYSGVFYSSSPILNAEEISNQDCLLSNTKLVNFRINEESFKQLDNKEKTEQLRDWLLFTMASEKGLSVDEFNKTFYDTPLIRSDFLKPISNSKYGKFRSLYVGKGKIITLVPNDISTQEKNKYLKNTINEYSKILNQSSVILDVFEYEINRNNYYGALTPTGTIKAEDLLAIKENNSNNHSIKLVNFSSDRIAVRIRIKPNIDPPSRPKIDVDPPSQPKPDVDVPSGNEFNSDPPDPTSVKTTLDSIHNGDLIDPEHINYIFSDENSVTITTKNNTTYRLENIDSKQATNIASASTSLKGSNIELFSLEMTRNISRTDNGIRVDTSIGSTSFGSFDISKKGNGFTVGWYSRDIDAGQSLVLELSKSSQKPEDFLRFHPQVKSLLKDQNNTVYYVKIKNSKHWLELLSSGGSGGKKPPNWQSRIAYSDDFGNRKFELRWLDSEEVNRLLKEGIFVQLPNENVKTGSHNQELLIASLENKDYSQAAQLIANTLDYDASEIHLERSLKKVDKARTNQRLNEAAQDIDILIELYGPRPELMLRRATIGLQQDKLKIQQVNFSLNKLINTPEIKAKFLDEINNLLSKNKKFKGVKKDNSLIYVQDTPGLNNIDWNQAIETSLPLISTKTKVYRLQDQEISNVKLSTMGFEDQSAVFDTSNDYVTYQGSFSRLSNDFSELEEESCKNQLLQEQQNTQQNQIIPKFKPNIYIIFEEI